MILRRVIAHFRKQEWTAIALDFVIVVVGVFVGIQVSNWNEERRTRMVEDDLLNRLYEETQELLELQSESLAALMVMVDVQLAINPVLFQTSRRAPSAFTNAKRLPPRIFFAGRPTKFRPWTKCWRQVGSKS